MICEIQIDNNHSLGHDYFFLISPCKAGFIDLFLGFVCYVFLKLDFRAAGFEKVHSPVVSDLIYDDFSGGTQVRKYKGVFASAEIADFP